MLKDMGTEAAEDGRRRHELALAMMTVAALEDKLNGNPGEPPVYSPMPGREKPQWSRRSAFRKGRR